MNIPQLPFIKEGDQVKLTGPCFLSCGCGQVIARWATIQQNLVARLPHAKPKSSTIAKEWIKQNKLDEKYPILKQKLYGVVVAETDGIEAINIMEGTTMKTAERIADLVRRSNGQ